MRLASSIPCLVLAAAVSACGGGGSGDPSGNGGAAPATGAYGWVLKAQGPTSAPTYGLSLFSAARPATEFQVEYGSAVLTDARVISSGAIDQANARTATLQPYALIYIVGGDVRRVSLQANGSLPATQVRKAGSTTACRFVSDANGRPLGDGVDYANPENSRFMVSTTGPDGQCGTADDGLAEVRLSGSDGLSVTALGSGSLLGMFRDPASLAPRGWIFTRSATTWNSGAGVSTALRPSSGAALQSVVQAAPSQALVDDGSQLSVIDFGSAGAPTETLLDNVVTGGGGWVGIGFDASAFYAYRNEGSGSTARWRVVKVTRGSPRATQLATAAGTVSVASMGSTLMYLTTLATDGNTLVAVSKSIGEPSHALESTPTSTLTTVQTSASGVHELWRIVNIGTAALNYQLEFIDETGARLYSTNAGGYPITVPDAQVQRFDTSESRTRFVFASGYGSRAFGDATLMGFDAAAGKPLTYGTLPGSASFGTDTVDVGAVGGPSGLVGGFAARSVAGNVQAAGTQVFWFDFATAGSLHLTTLSH